MPCGADDAFWALPDWSPSSVITGRADWVVVVVEAAAAAYERGWEELASAVTSGPVSAVAAAAVAAAASASEPITSAVKAPTEVSTGGGRGAGLSSTPFIDLAVERVRGRVLTPSSPWLARRCFRATLEVPMGTYKSERSERATRRSLSAASERASGAVAQ